MRRREQGRRLVLEALEGREVPAPLVGLTTFDDLVRFDSATPGSSTFIGQVTGLAGGQTLVGLDYRPAGGELYGMGFAAGTGQLYRLDPTNAVAVPVGAPFATNLTGTRFGFNFDPVTDLVRVTSNTGENLQVSPDTGALVAADAAINPADAVTAIAFTPHTAGATQTTLYGYDTTTNELVTIGSPNGTPNAPATGTLTPVGASGLATQQPADLGLAVTADGAAYLAAVVGGQQALYAVNLSTGAATPVGNFQSELTLTAIAAAAGSGPLAVSLLNPGGATIYPANPSGYSNVAKVTLPLVFPGFTGDVRTAVADVNGDGFPDIIEVTGPGTPIRFAVISGRDDTTLLVPPTAPFVGSEDFTGGGFVAAGDFDHSGRAEIVVSPDEGGGPRVSIWSLLPTGLTLRANFLGIDDPNFRGGARVAVGDVSGDGVPDLAVAAGFLGGPRVALLDGRSVLTGTPTKIVNDFFAFPGSDAATLRNGVYVAIGDVNGDGFGDLIFGGGPGGAPRVFVLSGQDVGLLGSVSIAQTDPIASFFVLGNSTDRGGVRVAAKDEDGDGKADVVAGSGAGSMTSVIIYPGKNFTGTGEPASEALHDFSGFPNPDGVYVG